MLALVSLALALAPAAPLQRPARSGQEAYRRVVASALARAQAALASSVSLDVDHSRWEDPWVVTSANFEVRTTHSYVQAFELAKNLEFLRSEFVRLLGEGRKPSGPAHIWVFPTMGEYNTFGGPYGEHSSILGSFFATDQAELPVATFYDGNWTQLGMWVTHSALHQHLAREFGRTPETWIDEGLASYFALAWDWKYGASQFAELAKARRLIPLERLLSDPIQAYVQRPHERFIELGMLFRYLLEVCEATKDDPSSDPPRGPFRDFLRAAVRGEPLAQSEFAGILASDADVLEEDFRAFDFSAW
jgi:hypothetical protein